MGVLLIRLAGTMQSWGTRSRFTDRDTDLEPSKSGVVGLLCAALGRGRTEPMDDLAHLRMGVRVDRVGGMARDFHTAKDVIRADGSGTQDSVVSIRYYLADAAFLVGLEGETDLLERISQALDSPVWPLYLGRKSFVPGFPVGLPDGLRQGQDLETALRTYPLTLRRGEKKPPAPLRLEIEVAYGQGDRVKQDWPLSFQERKFGLRHVKTGWVEVSKLEVKEEELCISPD